MKILLLGDLHLREKAPIGRIDDFPKTQYNKVKQILTIAKEHNAFIIQVGDFWDYPRQSKDFIFSYVKLFKEFNIPIYCVYGNHDLFSDKTPLYWLEQEGVVKVIREPIFIENLAIYGILPFGEIPQPRIYKPGGKNILVAHKMISNEPQLLAQNIVSCSQFANATPNFCLRVVGDYHFKFEHFENGWTVNPGAIVRLRRTQRDMEHIPAVVIWDSVTEEIKWVELQCKPAMEVFDVKEEEGYYKAS